MVCEQAINFLSARTDGELGAEDAAALEAHLAGCPDCRMAGETFAAQDAQLVRAFASRRVAAAAAAERAIVRLESRNRRWWWAAIPAAAAAGFLLAVVLLHQRTQTPFAPVVASTGPDTNAAGTQPASVAQLALATGQVEVRQLNRDEWHAMEPGGTVAAGACVRTAKGVRCEFQCPDASSVSLDERTQLQFVDARKMDLSDGQICSTTPRSAPAVVIGVPGGTVIGQGARCDIVTRSGETTLTVLRGSTRVRGRDSEAVVKEGERLNIAGGRLTPPGQVGDLTVAARWLDEILMMKGPASEELTRRVDDLMAQIGTEKMAYLYESEIRALGDHCVVPLTRYVQSDRSRGDPQRRVKAARILSDSAQPWCIPYLIELLEDRDGDVRAAAAGGLQRLVGFDMGRSAEQWKTQSVMQCRPTAQQWRDWWQENKSHIPAPRPETPTPQKA